MFAFNKGVIVIQEMALLEDLEGDCCEEELSEAQLAHYEQALKDHEEALTEANNIKKGNID